MSGDAKGYWFMLNLAESGYIKKCTDDWVLKTYSADLMLAISWEETKFSNIRQLEFSHEDWLKRWSQLDGQGRPMKNSKGQVVGNHAISYVQVERDTVSQWLANNVKLCLGLPGFEESMAFELAKSDKAPKEVRLRRIEWWKNLDLEILKSDEAGMALGWRTLAHIKKALPQSSKRGALLSYAGKNEARDNSKKAGARSGPKIVQGWLDTDACMRALRAIRPVGLGRGDGKPGLNAVIAGAYLYAEPDAKFASAFGATATDEKVRAINRIFEAHLERGATDSFVRAGKLESLAQQLGPFFDKP